MSDKISLKQILDDYISNNNKIKEIEDKKRIIKQEQDKKKDLILNIIEKKYNNEPIPYNGMNFMCKKDIKTSALSLKKIEELLKEYFKNDTDKDKAKKVFNYLKNNREKKNNIDLIIKDI